MVPTGEERSVPERCELIGEQLAVRWNDGHESFYVGGDLRPHCPCALCKTARQRGAGGGSPLRVLSPSETAAASARLTGWEPVGRYALRLVWSDRHDAGIYDFRLLRALCPCEACR